MNIVYFYLSLKIDASSWSRCLSVSCMVHNFTSISIVDNVTMYSVFQGLVKAVTIGLRIAIRLLFRVSATYISTAAARQDIAAA